MVTRWRRRRARKLLAGLLPTSEEIALVERLGLGGWWITTDQALYVVKDTRQPQRVPFIQIRVVQRGQGYLTATIRTTADEHINVAVRRGSAILDRLRKFETPPSDQQS